MVTHANAPMPYPRAGDTWFKAIRNAMVRGSFTHQDKVDANEWNSCAIGEMYRLLYHGRLFMEAVNEDNAETAFREYSIIRRAKPGQPIE